jgi:HTH-type transcriptional regulator/antitoxin HipB
MNTIITTKGQLSALLIQMRRQRGLSQQALGDKIGLSQERISRIERHPEKVTVDQLLTVLMALDAGLLVASRHEMVGAADMAVSGAAKARFVPGKNARPKEEW